MPATADPEPGALLTHTGGCHCGAVRFEVQAPAQVTVSECNCSICRMSGYLHLIVPAGRFRLLRGGDELRLYQFNTGTARHLFCGRCGVKSFYVPRSNPDGYSINVRCLDQVTLAGFSIEPFDDREREAAEALVRGRSRA
jgi:hypothetical protein